MTTLKDVLCFFFTNQTIVLASAQRSDVSFDWNKIDDFNRRKRHSIWERKNMEVKMIRKEKKDG